MQSILALLCAFVLGWPTVAFADVSAISSKNAFNEEKSHYIVNCGEATKPTLYVVAIGVNRYEDPKMPQLNFAIRDAEGFAEAIKAGARGGLFRQVDITVLRDTTTHGIEESVDRVVKAANPQDTFVLFYAGDGTEILIGSEKEKDDGGVDYWFTGTPERTAEEAAKLDTILPTRTITNRYDRKNVVANSITGAQLAALCSGVIANQQLVILDSCFSGASVPKMKELLLTKLDKVGLGRKLSVISIAGFTSENGDIEHGCLTKVLMDGLAGAADSNKNNEISVEELYDYGAATISRLDKYSKLGEKFISGGDFAIARVSSSNR